MDGLQSKGISASSYQQKLNGVNSQIQNELSLTSYDRKINREVSGANSKIKAPEDTIRKKINKKESAIRNKTKKKIFKIDSAEAKLNNETRKVNVPTTGIASPGLSDQNIPGNNALALPNLNLPSSNAGNSTNELNKVLNSALPRSQEIKKIESELSNVDGLPKQALKQTDILKDENEIRNDTKEVSQLEKQAKGYKKEIKGIKADSARMAAVDKDVEKAASNTEDAKVLKKEEGIVTTQKNALQQYQDMVKNLQKGDLTSAEKLSTQEVKNPFIGQEAKLQAGVMQLDKLKKKYRTIPDSRYLPKRAPNEMKDKLLKERIVPGVSFQVYQLAKVGLDISPYIMYRVSGRLRAGVGGSIREVIDSKKWSMTSGNVQAIRIMAEYRLLPSLYFHVEEEWMHYGYEASNVYRTVADPAVRVWNEKLNFGILKTYKIARRFDGQIQLLYNTFEWKNFPQNKNTIVRFGFEYKFGAKKVKPRPPNNSQ